MLEDFVAQNPTDSFARYGLALEMANGGETDAAIREFAKLVELNPDYTAAYQMWAQTLIKSGSPEDARPVLEKGIASAKRTGNQHAEREMLGLMDELEIG